MLHDAEGFGYTDALKVKPRKIDWLIEGLLPNGMGFLTGPPKAGNSPHGGKSMLSVQMTISLLHGIPCLGRRTPKAVRSILIYNLDEPQGAVSNTVKNLMSGMKPKEGIMLSNAMSLMLPRDINNVEKDIDDLKPALVIIDPLLRAVGGGDIKENSVTGKFIDGLRRLQRKYSCAILIIHHSVKDPARKKEDTSSWLNGSTDLNSAWDYCLGLDYERDVDSMRLRCFFKHAANGELRYVSRKNNHGEIVGFEIDARDPVSGTSELGVRDCLSRSDKTVQEIGKELSLSESTVKRQLQGLADNGEAVMTGKKGCAPVWHLNGVESAHSSQTIGERK